MLFLSLSEYTGTAFANFRFKVTTMASAIYKSRLIVSSPTFNPHNQRWTPYVIISWETGGRFKFHTIEGLPNLFANEEDAGEFGLEVGKQWIDREL
jgi:hypothetical protein